MSEDNMFKSDDKTEEAKDTSSASESKTDTKKDIDLDVVQKRLSDKDEFIKKLEKENQELRTSVEKAKTIDDVLARMKDQEGTSSEESVEGKDILKDVDRLIDTKFSLKEQESRKLEQERTLKDNAKKVVSALKNIYGDKAEEMFTNKAKELGKDFNSMQVLAATEPEMVLQLFKGSQHGSGSHTQGDVNTTAVLSSNDPDAAALSSAIKSYWKDPFNGMKAYEQIEKLAMKRGLK